MLRFVVLGALVALGSCRPGIVSTSYGHEGGSEGADFSLGSISLSGASHGLGDSSFGTGGHTLDLGGGGGGWSSMGGGGGGGWSSMSGGGGDSGGNSGGGDFHHGVSIVGGGGGGKGQIIDLTNQGDSHHGPFGGSFVASSKYSGHGGGDDGGDGGHGYGISEGGGFEGHYSDVLGASDDEGSSGGYESHGWN